MMAAHDENLATTPEELERRTFLDRVSSVLMAFGLTAGYGMFASFAGWFLYPRRRGDAIWQFVLSLEDVAVGESRSYVTPAGQRVAVTRTGDRGEAEDFIALSSVCPHLGCQVHWEPQNTRFFCPCHNGAFDAAGVATEGPPKDARQTLARYPLKVEGGMLFIEVPAKALV